MRKKSKILTCILSFILLLQTSNVFAITTNSNINVDLSKTEMKVYTNTVVSSEISELRKKAIKENKVIDIEKYDTKLKNAKTLEEKKLLYEELKKYELEKTIVYINNSNTKSLRSSPRIGDMRIVTSESYAANTTWDSKSGQTLSSLTGQSISLVTGIFHSATGVFMSILGMYIPPYDFECYKSVLERTLYDYRIRLKQVEVYQFDGINNYYWAPMASSEKRETFCQLNTVYYKNGVRQTPSNLDIGLVKEEYGDYYLDEDRLKSLAKSTSSPLYYDYNTGDSYIYNKDYKLKYK